MPHKYWLLIALVLGTAIFPLSLRAAECKIDDRPCVLGLLETEAATISETPWRDQTYRELAKTWAFEGNTDKAISLIDKIETPDTKAMTIRGIGMVAADLKLQQVHYDALFNKLREEAEKITHPPSYAIALTYIAMAQAFAGDNEGSWKTAGDMENNALRHKAYGETAEIQAERGDYAAAKKSIELIDSAAYRNKAYETIAKILADRKLLDDALQAAMMIGNSYKKAQALQYVLDAQKTRDIR